MKSILITGCNRGLGLGLVKQLAKQQNPPSKIIATCRNIEKAEELKNLQTENTNIEIIDLDLLNTQSFSTFAQKVENIVKDQGLNVLFNNAGFASKSTRINFVKSEDLEKCFAVNTIAPILLTKAILPLLKLASKQNESLPVGINRSAVINMSSILGSIDLTSDNARYPYKCSKAALNMFTKTLSNDLKNDKILVVSIHPGWVKTDMGTDKAPLSTDQSVRSILSTILTFTEQHSGNFYQYDGKNLKW